MIQPLHKNRYAAALLVVTIFAGFFFLTAGDSQALAKKSKGWLGVGIQEMTPSLREALNIEGDDGLLVTNVVAGSPADDAGIQEEDVIVEYDGESIRRSKDLVNLVRKTEPDKEVKIVVIRDGERKNFDVTIGKRRSSRNTWSWRGPGREDVRVFSLAGRPKLGVQVHELNNELAEYFNVEPKSGALVLEVNKNSPAEDAGLKAGDVITKAGDEYVRDPEDLIEALEEFEDSDEVEIEYVRKGKKETTKAELDFDDGRFGLHMFPGDNRLRFRHFNDPSGRDISIVIPEIHHIPEVQRRSYWDRFKNLFRHDDRQRDLDLDRILRKEIEIEERAI